MQYLINISLTIALLLPFFTLISYFWLFKKDNFFKKVRPQVQLMFFIWFLIIVLIELFVWRTFNFSYHYSFIGINLEACSKNNNTPLITVMAGIVAVIGWLFTSRIQVTNSVKTHAVQALLNSRNSAAYVDRVDITMKINRLTNSTSLSVKEYKKLKDKEKSAITYMLNFLEFTATGIRYGNLDEEIVKASFSDIYKNSWDLYKEIIIEYFRHERKSSNCYEELEQLNKYWQTPVLDKKKIPMKWVILTFSFIKLLKLLVDYYNKKVNPESTFVSDALISNKEIVLPYWQKVLEDSLGITKNKQKEECKQLKEEIETIDKVLNKLHVDNVVMLSLSIPFIILTSTVFFFLVKDFKGLSYERILGLIFIYVVLILSPYCIGLYDILSNKITTHSSKEEQKLCQIDSKNNLLDKINALKSLKLKKWDEVKENELSLPRNFRWIKMSFIVNITTIFLVFLYLYFPI